MGENLWLETEPEAEQIKTEIDKRDLLKYNEVVFCGFGEPTERLDVILEISKYVKEKADIPIRINTNGLSDLINQKPTAHLFAPYVDNISISLNAPTKEEYDTLCRPRFGKESFDAVLSFGVDAKKYVKHVAFSVVDVIGEEKIKACQKICDDLGISLKIRKTI